MSNFISELDNETERVNEDFADKLNIVSTVSRKEVAERRAAREAELRRLAALIAREPCGQRRDDNMADLLAFLGVIHDTPSAKHNWIHLHN